MHRYNQKWLVANHASIKLSLSRVVHLLDRSLSAPDKFICFHFRVVHSQLRLTLFNEHRFGLAASRRSMDRFRPSFGPLHGLVLGSCTLVTEIKSRNWKRNENNNEPTVFILPKIDPESRVAGNHRSNIRRACLHEAKTESCDLRYTYTYTYVYIISVGCFASRERPRRHNLGVVNEQSTLHSNDPIVSERS